MNAIVFDGVTKHYRIGGSAWPTFRDRLDYLILKGKNLLLHKRNVSSQDHEFNALKDATFTIRKGESIAIIGPNGAGKSTILKLLAGVTKPNSGKIDINGRVAAMIELGAGLHPELTGRENIYLYGAIMGMKRAQVDDNIDKIIEFSELEDFIDTPLKRYSSGMQARLGFSVTAHIDADILLVDEVLSVGDMRFQFKCADKLAEYRKKGITIVFVSHNLESVSKLCQRTILLDRGQIEKDGSTDECIRDYYKLMGEDRVRRFQKENPTEKELKTQAKIRKIELFNEAGETTRNLQAGDRAVLRLEIECFEDLPNPHIGFIIKTLERTNIFDTNNALLGYDLGNLKANTKFITEFRFKVNLLKGTYTIGTHFEFERLGSGYYDWVDPAITFKVNENYSHHGIVDLSPEFKVLEITKI